MHISDELVYWFRRSVEERIRAETATHEKARSVHRQLAMRYEQQLRRYPGGARWLDGPSTPRVPTTRMPADASAA